MRRIEHLIRQSRRATENERVGSTDGIQTEEFVEYMNNGQERIHSQLVQTHKHTFALVSVINAVEFQEEYDVPEDIFVNHHIISIEYSYTGNDEDYYALKFRTVLERNSVDGYPHYYSLRNRTIVINPIVDKAGLFRITYEPILPKLDIRRGQVSDVTLNPAGNTITTLTLDTSFDPTIANANFDEDDYMTVVNREGEIQMKGIPYDAVNPSTGAVTVTSGFSYETGETIATGDYVCLGKRSTTHSQLIDSCEKYLLAYCNWKILKRDSSVDSTEQFQELQLMEQDIIGSVADEAGDVQQIPYITQEFS